MGYYTAFNMSVVSKIPENRNLIQEFRQVSTGAEYALDMGGGSKTETKWYNWEEDLRKFSAKFPNVLFLLEGEGEENGDLWKAYFKGGKMQLCKAEVTYPKYDENELT
jgi:hypothetical protein